MRKSTIIEKWIIEQISEEKFKPNNLVPSEIDLMEKFKVSRMTVKLVFQKLVSLGVLYQAKRKGFYVSPFYDGFNYNKTESTLKIETTKVLPTSQKPPRQILEKFKLCHEYESKSWLGYVKIYFQKDKVVSYAISWINKNEVAGIEFVDLERVSCSEYIYKVLKQPFTQVDVTTLETPTKQDVEILKLTKDVKLVPNIYYSYYTPSGKILQLRISKTQPDSFKKTSMNFKLIAK